MSATASFTSDFTEAELLTLQETWKERYGELPELPFDEADTRLARHDRQRNHLLIVAWLDGVCTLLVARAGAGDYRAEFFHRVPQHFGTGFERFGNLAECVVTLLQVQADHARAMQREVEEAPSR